ncbi:MAG: hypothetical protein QM671_24080 [Bacillus sp. (in: firmicutes)]|uniref:hypothetical protein n=1 Tax=Bacillus sp. TaxID=1409 RepID=UPI0039E48E41
MDNTVLTLMLLPHTFMQIKYLTADNRVVAQNRYDNPSDEPLGLNVPAIPSNVQGFNRTITTIDIEQYNL